MRRLLLWVCLLASLAHAETFVIAAGVEKYDDERISPLKYACADARSLAAVIRASGVPARNVFILGSDSALATARPTRIALLGVLERVRERAAAGDKVIFFFAGHGVEEGGEQFLLTVDTRRSLLEDTALPMRLVSKALNGVQANAVVLLIDACRNDPNAGRSDSDAVLSDGMARGVRPLLQPAVGAKPALVATLLACDVGQRAYEDPERGHGAFTVALLRGLSGEAKAADGLVHLTGLAEFVRREVGVWSERSQHQQTPRLVNPDGGDVDLLKPPAELLVSLTLKNQPLSDVVALLGEQYGAQIVLGKGVDSNAAVTGRLENQPMSAALQVLLVAYDLTVRRKGAVYIIESEGIPPEPAPPTPAKADLPANWPPYLDKWRDQMPAGLQYRVRDKDGMPQVLIPAGAFRMGPGHERRVFVSDFWIDVHDVTVGQYQRFCQATGRQLPPQREWAGGEHPVVVGWQEAATYGEWVGGRLPTEAEWEKAARGGTSTTYYWGEKWDPSRANAARSLERSSVVASYPPNPFAMFDMCGNVWNWCQDAYDSDWYAKMPSRDPCNRGSQFARVIRGGAWGLDETYAGVAARNYVDASHPVSDCGFRVVGPSELPPSAAQTDLPPNWPAYLAKWRDQMPAGMQYRVREKDGMPQVLIPAGEFLMGSPEGQGAEDEHPQKWVNVSAFWMDMHEVTVGQFKRFCEATGNAMSSGNDDDSHPVVDTRWSDARAYCDWVGARLPTEAQWEKAARGGTATAYPWGDQWDAKLANGSRSGPGKTTPVGAYAPNAFGLFDMVGNAWEWCEDWYDPKWYASMPSQDPCNHAAQDARVLRGGSVGGDPPDARVAFRKWDGPGSAHGGNGFRTVGPAGANPTQ